ncbi:MAG: T9SS type A sorting domain-containing protein, partial [Bacteroidia bacterium]
NGCTSSCNKTLSVNSLPVCSITGGNFCQGGSTQLCAATNTSYIWSTGATTQCVIASTGGTFTVTVTNQNGCSSSCSKTVTGFTPPTCSITGGNFCDGSTTQLCGATNSGYLWSTGATTQCVTVSSGGTYTITVTDANGCSSSCSKTVTAFTPPSCAITGNGSICSGGSTQWCAPAGLSGYLWNTGATTQCITVSTANTFTVTVTDANGCTSSCNKILTVNQVATCSITGNSSICSGSSTQWCAAAGLSTYSWSTGATTQCITVSSASTYTVTTSDGNGCISNCNKTLTVNPLPSCSITGSSSVCSGNSTQWCAPAGLTSYLWSTGATTQCITVSTASSYTVTTTNANGCSSSCNKTLTVRGLPSCTITGTTSICPGSSTQWCAPAGLAGYLWSTGATTQCITVSTAGTYTITTTSSFGCTSSCNKALTIKKVPGSKITGSGSVCSGNSTQWCAPAGLAAYLWSTGATTQCITVSAGGTYTVTTSNAGGCTSSSSKTLTANSLPSCSISGNSSVCSGKSTQWCVAAGYSGYLWSTGATTKCINVSTAATYTITITSSSGCTSSCSQTLTVNPIPSCLITGNGSVCVGFSTQWCAPAGLSGYLWSTGATTQCVTVSTAGTYSVTTTNSSGCTSKCSKTLVVNTNNATITPDGPTTFCEYDPLLTLCASAGVTYIWDTGEITQCIPANDKTHLYVVTVTDGNGCVGTDSQQVIENVRPTVTINAPSTLPICGLPGNTLTGSSEAGNLFGWSVTSSDNSWVINGSTTGSSISYKAGNAGVCATFTLTVTNPSTGCKRTTTLNLCSQCEQHCSYDQGLYGTLSATSCDGLTMTQLLTNLLSTTLVSGNASRTVSILSSEVSCAIDKLPSKTASSALPVGNVTCAAATGSAYLTSGQFKHALLGEAIALGLNVRLDPSLTNLVMAGPYMTTYKANTCTGGKAVNGTKLVYAIPQSVLNYLGSNNTVGNLLLLANQALGATYIPTGSNPTIAEIDSAVKSINYGFDKCRILAGFGTSSSGVRAQDQLQHVQNDGMLKVNAYPNPFNSTATIEFISSARTTHTTVEIYSLSGNKITTLFDGEIDGGNIYKVEFNAKNLAEGIYVYRIISGDNVSNGKLILIK